MKLYYGWVIVAAGALMGCVAIGAVFSLAVFLQPMSDATGWSRTGVSSAMTIVFLTMGIASFGWGALTDRFGPRIVVLSGGCCWGWACCWPAAPEPARIPAHLRHHRGRRGGRGVRADHDHDHGMVREASQPRRLAGVGRHGRGADDRLALRELLITNYDWRTPSSDRHPGLGGARADRLPRAPPARQPDERERIAAAPGVRWALPTRHDGRPGTALAAVLGAVARPTSAAAPRIPARSSIP